MGLLGSVVGAVGSIAGGLIGSQSQANANQANGQLQQQNQAWMKEMSDTAVQRRVADMKKAGINPLLSVGGASAGASTPSSSPATMQKTFDPTTIGALLTSVSNAKVAEAEKKRIESETLTQESNQRKQDISNLKMEIETGNLTTQERRNAEMHLKKLEHEDAQIGNINSTTQFNESKHRVFNKDIANTPDGQKQTHYSNIYGGAWKTLGQVQKSYEEQIEKLKGEYDDTKRRFNNATKGINDFFKGKSNAKN